MKIVIVECDMCERREQFDTKTAEFMTTSDITKELIDMGWMLGNVDLCPGCREEISVQDEKDRLSHELAQKRN